MTTTSNCSSDPAGDLERPALWAGLGTLIVAALAWATRDRWLAALSPYGLSAQATGTVTRFPGTPGAARAPDITYGTGHFHITPAGWLTLGIVAAGVMATLWCAVRVAVWVRWRAARGMGAVPILPVPSAAVVVAAGVFMVVQVVFGRQTSAMAHMVVFMGGAFVAVAAWFVVMVCAMGRAAHWQLVQAFAARADRVLGHEHPGVGRVHVRAGWGAQLRGRGWWYWPHTLVAVTGPRWQHSVGELEALNRCTRAFGWPSYEWVRDPISQCINGTVCPDHRWDGR